MELPGFRYHPDPVGTGTVRPSSDECVCCRERRGHIYVGPVFAEAELNEALCLWCIADGSAHERLGAEFIDTASVGLGWEPVAQAVVEELAFRTPCFTGWQQERWFTHCADAGEFLGRADTDDLRGKWAAVRPAMQADAGMSDEEWNRVANAFAKGPNDSPTAYVFRCLHCGQLGGYWDTD
jgi:uncharacterized protein CbrC (UPF0167 family)